MSSLAEGFQSLVIFSVREETQLFQQAVTLQNAPRFAKFLLQSNFIIFILKMAILSQSFLFSACFCHLHRMEIQNPCSQSKLRGKET